MSDTESKSAAMSTAEAKSPSQAEFHFIRSPLFRAIPADGAWFGPDSTGTIHLTFYNEYFTIPDKVVVNLDEKGQAVGDPQHIGKEGMTRELEVDVVMNFPDVLNFYNTLGQNLRQWQEILKQNIPKEAQEIMKKAQK